MPHALVGLLLALVVGLGAYALRPVLTQVADSKAKTFRCSAGGFTGYIRFSDTSLAIVSYKIDPGDNSGGKSADISVTDGGVTPPRSFHTSEGVQDAAYHAFEGPYERSGGGLSFRFTFDKNNRNDPSCSGKAYLAVS